MPIIYGLCASGGVEVLLQTDVAAVAPLARWDERMLQFFCYTLNCNIIFVTKSVTVFMFLKIM
jgi:hypothetical protein